MNQGFKLFRLFSLTWRNRNWCHQASCDTSLSLTAGSCSVTVVKDFFLSFQMTKQQSTKCKSINRHKQKDLRGKSLSGTMSWTSFTTTCKIYCCEYINRGHTCRVTSLPDKIQQELMALWWTHLTTAKGWNTLSLCRCTVTSLYLPLAQTHSPVDLSLLHSLHLNFVHSIISCSSFQLIPTLF